MNKSPVRNNLDVDLRTTDLRTPSPGKARKSLSVRKRRSKLIATELKNNSNKDIHMENFNAFSYMLDISKDDDYCLNEFK